MAGVIESWKFGTGKTSHNMADGRSLGDSPGIREVAVRAELQKVLESHEFRASKRCQDFLRFVVENTLGGKTDILKERTIGIEAFGRPASYDPSDDATVRVKAGEVRKRLGLYYAGEGRGDGIRIELPAGGYIPDFVVPPAAGAGIQPLAGAAPVRRPSAYFAAGAITALALAAGAAMAAWIVERRPPSALDQFWAPVLAGASPALLCAAYVPDVYAMDGKPGLAPRIDDFTRLSDQFVGGGDLMAAARLAAMLTRMGRAYNLRIGNEVTFQDLRASPAIFIGYSYSRWRDMSDQLRYFIDISQRPARILDAGKPTNWYLPNLGADRHTDEDYAIVSRVYHPDTRSMLVEISGITQYGTEAAADLVSNAELLQEALRGAPPDWTKKNLQLVLHVKVISGSPAPATAVANYFW